MCCNANRVLAFSSTPKQSSPALSQALIPRARAYAIRSILRYMLLITKNNTHKLSATAHISTRLHRVIWSHAQTRARPSSRKLAGVLETNFKLIRIKVVYSFGQCTTTTSHNAPCAGFGAYFCMPSFPRALSLFYVYRTTSAMVVTEYKLLQLYGHYL